MLPLKSSRSEQHAVIAFLWVKRPYANQKHSEMHPVYGNKCFTKPAVHVSCKKMLVKNSHQTLRCSWSFVSGLDSSQHHSLDRALRSLLTDGTTVSTNSDALLKNETLIFNV